MPKNGGSLTQHTESDEAPETFSRVVATLYSRLAVE